ncbi:MAG: hypothetical protein ABIJ59_11850 [Pseudomonadota bacterium]
MGDIVHPSLITITRKKGPHESQTSKDLPNRLITGCMAGSVNFTM